MMASMDNPNTGAPHRGWEYARSGDYHRKLDPNWSYTPTYLRKMACVRRFIESLSQEARILDAGCGEGVLVEEFHHKGRNIEGLDYNYESPLVRRGDVRHLPYSDRTFDAIVHTDGFEHLAYEDQPKCLAEFRRVLKPGGQVLISVPNLAHFNSRVRFLLRGMLDRTDIETNHVGERPFREYLYLLREAGFTVTEYEGITFTLPWVYRRLICRHAARLRWLHDLMEPLARSFPSLSMLTVFVCRNASEVPKAGQLSRRARSQIEQASGYPGMFSIYTHMTELERVRLFELAHALPAQATIVEIGSYLGASTCFLAGGVRATDGKVVAVDTWTNIGMTEGSRDTYAEFLGNTEPLQKWITPRRGFSKDIAVGFDQPIDLLFVDGDHSYEAVRMDLEAWLPKMKDGGIVVFHDFSWAEGVQRAVRELVVPRQIEGGRRADSLYWTRIKSGPVKQPRQTLVASVIVPTFGRPAYLRDTVASLLGQELSGNSYEVIVVDNKPTGEVRRIVGELQSGAKCALRYVEEPQLGLHNGRHAGARHAAGEILVYVDDDVIAPSSWLGSMVQAFADEKVGMVGGKTVPQWEGFSPPEWIEKFGHNGDGYLSILDLGENPILDGLADAYGCNMAVRRDGLFLVGGFSPDGMGDRSKVWLRGDGESVLKPRLQSAGYKIAYSPQAWLYHRIPPNRVTEEYFCWRGLIQGISDSFTYARRHQLSPWRSVRHAARCHLNCLKHLCRDPFSIRNRVARNYWYGRGQHQLRLALSPTLRQHVYRETYL